jgi:hypothetical protein
LKRVTQCGFVPFANIVIEKHCLVQIFWEYEIQTSPSNTRTV